MKTSLHSESWRCYLLIWEHHVQSLHCFRISKAVFSVTNSLISLYSIPIINAVAGRTSPQRSTVKINIFTIGIRLQIGAVETVQRSFYCFHLFVSLRGAELSSHGLPQPCPWLSSTCIGQKDLLQLEPAEINGCINGKPFLDNLFSPSKILFKYIVAYLQKTSWYIL